MAEGVEDEVPSARVERNWNDLLQELRLVQNGPHILFAFLLVVAFSDPFQQADGFAHAVFAVTLVATGMSTALVLAPAPVHRFVYRGRVNADFVRVGVQMEAAALLLMMVAIAGGLLLALDVVLPRPGAIAVVAVLVVWYAAFWYVVPRATLKRAQARARPTT